MGIENVTIQKIN